MAQTNYMYTNYDVYWMGRVNWNEAFDLLSYNQNANIMTRPRFELVTHWSKICLALVARDQMLIILFQDKEIDVGEFHKVLNIGLKKGLLDLH